MQLVNSSNLFAVDYDPWNATLIIEFHSERIYEYYRVLSAEYSGLMAANSHGQYFHAHIKGRYAYRRIR